MKIFPTLWLIALFPFIKSGLTTEVNKIKVTKFDVRYVKKSFIDNFETKVQKVNNTYNRLEMKFDNIQDFPEKPFFNVSVLRSTKSSSGPWRKLGYYSVRLCDPNDDYRNYLPNVLKQAEGDKCFAKGKFDVKDAGIFKFWELLPEELLKKSYFLSVNTLGVDDQTLLLCRASSQSTDM